MCNRGSGMQPNSVLLGLCTASSVMFGILVVQCFPTVYRASAIVGAPVSPDPVQMTQVMPLNLDVGLSSVFGAYSRQLSSNAVPPETLRYRTLLTSTVVAKALISNEHLERTIFRDEWNAEHQTWHEPDGVGNWLARALSALVGLREEWAPPDADRLARYVEEHVALTSAEDGRAVRIQYWNQDRAFSAIFLRALVRETHLAMQKDADQHYANIIDSMSKALSEARDTEIREALIQQVSRQELLRSIVYTGQFGYDMIDPPSVTREMVDVNPFVVLSLFGFAGFYIGMLILFLRTAVRVREQPLIAA